MVDVQFTSMSVNWQRKSLAVVTSSPCLELVQANSTSIAALHDMRVRTLVPLLKRYSSSTTKP